MDKTNFRQTAVRLIVALALFVPSRGVAELLLNGYGSVGVSKSDHPSIFEGWTGDELDYKSNTQLAVNMVQEVSKKFSANTQVIARGEQDFEAELRLMNLVWYPEDSSFLRLGKIRLPILLMSEYQEVGLLFPWSKPPGELYNLPIDTVVGVNGATTFSINADWSIQSSFTAGGGTNKAYSSGQVAEGDAKDIFLFNLDLLSSRWHLRAGAGRADYSGQLIQSLPGTPPTYVQITTAIPIEIQDAEFLVGGVRYQSERILLQSEIVNLKAKLTQARQNLFTSHYLNVGTYWGENYLVHVTRSVLRETETPFISGEQVTHAIGLNYIYSRDLIFKADYKRVSVEGGRGNFRSQPNRDVNIGDLSINFSF